MALMTKRTRLHIRLSSRIRATAEGPFAVAVLALLIAASVAMIALSPLGR